MITTEDAAKRLVAKVSAVDMDGYLEGEDSIRVTDKGAQEIVKVFLAELDLIEQEENK